MAKSVAYYSTPIGELLEETPEGFLISRDCCIGRTGWQTYKVSEIPKEAADQLGIDVSKPNADIDLYRDPAEVFHGDTLASFEGKPVTDGHPPSFVDPDNFNEYSRGHLQNVRKGREPLDSGEWPMIADVHITAEPLLSKVRNKLVRELSCGYDYNIRRDGDRILQCDITGNHVAVVPKGRAGGEARVNDAATSTQSATSTSTVVSTKEKKPVKSRLKHLLGLGLKEYAKDADPEDLAATVNELHEEPPAQSADKRGKDNPGEQEPIISEDRKAAHAALDRALDAHKGKDSDISGLEKHLNDFFEEEKEEPEHSEAAVDTSAIEDALEEGTEDAAAVCPECGEAPCVCEEAADAADAEEEEEPEEARVRAADGAKAVLKTLRPVIARTKDAKVRSAFNAALASVSRSSKPSNGSYGGFANTARGRDKAPQRPAAVRAADSKSPDRETKLQAAYNDAHRGGKK